MCHMSRKILGILRVAESREVPATRLRVAHVIGKMMNRRAP